MYITYRLRDCRQYLIFVRISIDTPERVTVRYDLYRTLRRRSRFALYRT